RTSLESPVRFALQEHFARSPSICLRVYGTLYYQSANGGQPTTSDFVRRVEMPSFPTIRTGWSLPHLCSRTSRKFHEPISLRFNRPFRRRRSGFGRTAGARRCLRRGRQRRAVTVIARVARRTA